MVTVNGEEKNAAGKTIYAYLLEEGYDTSRVVVEQNLTIIPQDQLENTMIKDARFPRGMKEKFLNARVAVAGLGGLGSNIAVMLARSGVGHLLLVDFDTVDVTNLNRQMYMIPHLG